MAFQFLCPRGHLLQGEASQVGQACQCPVCGAAFLVPPPRGQSPPGRADYPLPAFQPPRTPPSAVPVRPRPKFEVPGGQPPPPLPLPTGAPVPGVPRAQPIQASPTAGEAPAAVPAESPAKPFPLSPGTDIASLVGLDERAPLPFELAGPGSPASPAKGLELPFDPSAEDHFPLDLPQDETPPGEGPQDESPEADRPREPSPWSGSGEGIAAETAEQEEGVVHIPCPAGHVLETPRSAIGQHAMCPYCGAGFFLRMKDSLEYRQRVAKIEKRRDRAEQQAGQVWLAWAIAAAVLVAGGLIALLATMGR